MTGYLINFSIYTLAMIGIIFVALFVFKTFSGKCLNKKSSALNIEETMTLSPRKTLYVINANGERFLISSDTDRTSLISKLNTAEEKATIQIRADKSDELGSLDGIESLSEFASIIDFQKKSSQKKLEDTLKLEKDLNARVNIKSMAQGQFHDLSFLDNATTSPKPAMMKELARKLSTI